MAVKSAKCSDTILRPIRGIFVIILRIFWYCFRAAPAQNTNYKESTSLSLMNDEDDTLINGKPKGPLIAFSYAGMLWAYYLGVIAFLRDHFDLLSSNIHLSGISAGTAAVFAVFFELTIEQAFDFGLEWQRLFDSRPLKFWFLSTSQILHMLSNKIKSFGINDEILAKQYKKFGGCDAIHFGVTALEMRKFFKWRMFHVCLGSFGTMKQFIYAALCSMRTVPFFRTLGFYDGHYVLDGGLTANYSIPERYRKHKLDGCDDKDKVIRIAVMKHDSIQSDIAPKHNFKWNEWIMAGDLKDNLKRFDKGYEDAAGFVNICNCAKKGLIWNNAEFDDYKMVNTEEWRQRWNEHVNERISAWNEKVHAYFAEE